MKKEERYRFLTREECIEKFGAVRPPDWNSSGAMDNFLGKEVPLKLAQCICEYGNNHCMSNDDTQPEFLRWSFLESCITTVKKSDGFFE
jgi:hypothetical protein